MLHTDSCGQPRYCIPSAIKSTESEDVSKISVKAYELTKNGAIPDITADNKRTEYRSARASSADEIKRCLCLAKKPATPACLWSELQRRAAGLGRDARLLPARFARWRW